MRLPKVMLSGTVLSCALALAAIAIAKAPIRKIPRQTAGRHIDTSQLFYFFVVSDPLPGRLTLPEVAVMPKLAAQRSCTTSPNDTGKANAMEGSTANHATPAATDARDSSSHSSGSQYEPPGQAVGVGLKGRLQLAFAAITLMVVIATVVSLFAFFSVGKSLDRITVQALPRALSAGELLAKAEFSVAAGPALLASTTVLKSFAFQRQFMRKFKPSRLFSTDCNKLPLPSRNLVKSGISFQTSMATWNSSRTPH